VTASGPVGQPARHGPERAKGYRASGLGTL